MTIVKPDAVKFMLMAANMRRAVRFYRDTFGFPELFVSDWWSELSLGGAILALHSGHDGSPHPTGLSLQFPDVMAAAERIEQAGGRVIEAPRQREGEPILLGVFRDPEGNEVFMTEYVG